MLNYHLFNLEKDIKAYTDINNDYYDPDDGAIIVRVKIPSKNSKFRKDSATQKYKE